MMSDKVTNTMQPTRTLAISPLRKNESIQNLIYADAVVDCAVSIPICDIRQRYSCEVTGARLGSIIYTSPSKVKR